MMNPQWLQELIDPCEDVLQKAQLGWVVSTRDLAEVVGIPFRELRELRSGIDPDAQGGVFDRLSGALRLDPGALRESCKASWLPEARRVAGVEQFVTPFADFHVNHFLITCSQTGESCLFDTGTSADALMGLLARQDLRLVRVYLTHGHRDHLAQLGWLRGHLPEVEVVAHPRCPGPVDRRVSPGMRDVLGGLELEIREGTAHKDDMLVFAVSGLEVPVVVAGDALFAGSIGAIKTGRREDFEASLESVRRNVLCGREETVILPGHGPITTVGEERVHNPFFAFMES